MNERDDALRKAKALTPRRGSLAAYLKELTLRGFFDSPAQSRDVVKAVRDQFGRKFPVSYVQTYMKPFLEAGILRGQDSPEGRGFTWLGAWLARPDGAGHHAGEKLSLKVDTTGWPPEVAEDFHLGVSCYSDKLWKPAAVMVRRAYEGALILKYRSAEGTDPEKQVTCPKCSTRLGGRPLSITDLHYWAARAGLVREKMEGLSVLLKDLGAGGAHPTKSNVIDPDTAEIIIKCGAVLLRDLHKNNNNPRQPGPTVMIGRPGPNIQPSNP
jgi:hypothetical protein